jgi:hypothetical protein
MHCCLPLNALTGVTPLISNMRMIWLVAVALGIAAPGAAEACGFSADQSRILHEELAEVPAGEIAAEVEIIHAGSTGSGFERSQVNDPVKARIIRMLRGTFRGDTIFIDRRTTDSCDIWPKRGERGIIVGRVLSISDAALTVTPRRALSSMQVWAQERREARWKVAITGLVGLLTIAVVGGVWLRRRRTILSTDPL